MRILRESAHKESVDIQKYKVIETETIAHYIHISYFFVSMTLK